MTQLNFLTRHLSRWYFLKSEINRLLMVSVAFGMALLLARIVYTGQLMFSFLVWNLFLAFIPYLISYTLTQRPSWIENKWIFSAIVLVWLVFVPNSFYILTDLFHLTQREEAPIWFDLILITTFAWNALLMGILSVRNMECIIQPMWLYRRPWLFIYPVMWLNALGVYIGRFMRFNSWDVISNPFHLVRDIAKLHVYPMEYKGAWGMVVCFSVFFTIVYLTIKKISKALW
jgi:uncharacterized membrane protein